MPAEFVLGRAEHIGISQPDCTGERYCHELDDEKAIFHFITPSMPTDILPRVVKPPCQCLCKGLIPNPAWGRRNPGLDYQSLGGTKRFADSFRWRLDICGTKKRG